MDKKEIELRRINIIDTLNDDMYNTALRQLKELVNNMCIEDMNENERICYQELV